MPPPSLGRGLFVLGSLTGPVIFAGAQTKQTRIVSTTGEVKGDLLSEVRVGPWFSGWRMREGASPQTKNLAYSYGYVVRLDGSENAKQEKRTVENETFDTKGTRDGKLTLIETKLGPKEEGDKSGPSGKNRLVPIVGGFTKKKFFLLGMGKNNKVEFEALVSIVGDEGRATAASCWKTFKENEGDKQMRENIKSTFNNGPLLLSDELVKKLSQEYQGPIYSKQGRALIGNCAQEFYKNKSESGIPFIEQLKGDSGSQIGLQELSIKEGMSIAIAQGLKKGSDKKEDIIAPGILVKNQFNDGSKTLWVGLQGDGKAKMDKVKTQYRARGQGWVAVLDWRSTKSEENLGMSGGTNQVKKITLDKSRRYFLWDPSYTHIKNGKLITVDGQNIPWESDIQIPFKTQLVK